MPRRIDAGEVLAAVGGALVVVALFLSWFEGASGWEAFEALDLVILALGLVTLWAAASDVLSLPSALTPRALPVLGAVLLVIVAVQLIEPPPVFAGIDPDRETGAWLALAGSALVLLGGVLRAAKISVTISVGGRDVRRRVPAVDRRPGAAPGEPTAATGLMPGAPALEPEQATQAFTPVDPAASGHPDPSAAAAATPDEVR